MDQRVFDIAHRVRQEMVEYAHLNSMDYDLCGLCAVAAGILHNVLKKSNIKSIINLVDYEYEGCHCFLTLDENDILDITATQFNRGDMKFSPVEYVTKDSKRFRKYWFWGDKSDASEKWKFEVLTFDSSAALRRNQVKDHWIPDQLVFDYQKSRKIINKLSKN